MTAAAVCCGGIDGGRMLNVGAALRCFRGLEFDSTCGYPSEGPSRTGAELRD